MKTNRKILAVILSGVIFLSNTSSYVINAQGVSENNEMQDVVDINKNMRGLESFTLAGIIDEAMKNENLTQEEAVNFLGVNQLEINSSNETLYWIISQQITVKDDYKPTIKFYAKASYGGGPYFGVQSILNTSLDRNYKGETKQFAGNIYTNLESNTKIFYIINGDFYNNGNTIIDSSRSKGVDEAISTSFNISNETNHFTYTYLEGRYHV